MLRGLTVFSLLNVLTEGKCKVAVDHYRRCEWAYSLAHWGGVLAAEHPSYHSAIGGT